MQYAIRDTRREANVKDFRRLEVWEKAHQMVLAVYRATNSLPRFELYGLTSQIRRAAASIPANIAEGCGRMTDGDFARFLQIAMGSATELDYHLLLAKDLGFLSECDYQNLSQMVHRVKSMLAPLIRKVEGDRARV